MNDKEPLNAWRIELGDWDALGTKARIIRTEVFLNEQQVPVELEWDDMDAVSLHAVALDSAGNVLATGRLLPDGHIGRMAVRRAVRDVGVGSAILSALLDAARKRGLPEARLNAQTHAEGFYARFGFEREGDEFPDAGIPHIHMRARLA
ncbi:putative GNAT family N-acyltransferase [Paucimonas lemoignei]|uniref:Putative GNAT family N-acyltransferase n=1 Tax=Paucimonas lemoignei TaxID=29443 RepID=A0A4R3I182_PAULE|nr:GNAT family N-acetyltransferase [Paucimonas lemoignei]TCS39496.1 putative GNAT family N-acyltransferase [Paucimonas lemoignei]